MKTARTSLRSLAKFGLVFLATVSAVSVMAQATEKSVKVVRVSGGARYQAPGGQWQEIKQGDELKAGTVIQTAKDSTLDLLLAGSINNVSPSPNAIANGTGQRWPTPSFPGRPTASVVRLYGDTVLSIDKLTCQGEGADQVTETMLDLRAGRLFGSTQKVKGASKYEIKLPNGVAAVRGTIYSVSAEGAVAVMSGSVFVTLRRADGSTVTQQVTSGNSFDPNTGVMTPISGDDALAMMAASADAGRTLYSDPGTFTTDATTTIWVSPTAGGSPSSPPND
jgi:hypothetical protein